MVFAIRISCIQRRIPPTLGIISQSIEWLTGPTSILKIAILFTHWNAGPGIPTSCLRRTLFYLDAHWEEHLPLRNELELISRKFNLWIAVIDDFNVPGDDGYGFDNYGAGQILNMDYIRQCKINNAAIFFPNVSSKWETGAKRGSVGAGLRRGPSGEMQSIAIVEADATIMAPTLFADMKVLLRIIFA